MLYKMVLLLCSIPMEQFFFCFVLQIYLILRRIGCVFFALFCWGSGLYLGATCHFIHTGLWCVLLNARHVLGQHLRVTCLASMVFTLDCCSTMLAHVCHKPKISIETCVATCASERTDQKNNVQCPPRAALKRKDFLSLSVEHGREQGRSLNHSFGQRRLRRGGVLHYAVPFGQHPLLCQCLHCLQLQPHHSACPLDQAFLFLMFFLFAKPPQHTTT